MITVIDAHRETHGLEPRSGSRPICRVLLIAPSTYHAHAARRADPSRSSARARGDAALMVEIRRVWEETVRVRGVRKVWRQLGREGIALARCTVARLVRAMSLQGAMRGKPVRTTVSDKAAPCPLDRVNRLLQAPRPNALRVSGFTCVSTWTGFVCVAFVIDAHARRIVGWRVSRTARAGFVLDALEQALHARRPVQSLPADLIRGAAASCTTRTAACNTSRSTTRSAWPTRASSPRSAASATRAPARGLDPRDNALAETINGLFKAEVIHRRGPWRSFEAVELATLEWVSWFNTRRLLEPIGNMPPAEAEARRYAQAEAQALAA